MNSTEEVGNLLQTKSIEALCANLSFGLHAAAQPLAILRASLGSDQIEEIGPEELRELLLTSAGEVERVCALFSCMQQLVSTETVKPHLGATQILPLLSNAIEGVELLFQEDGMALSVMKPEVCAPVLIDAGRTLRALSSILVVAHSVSRAMDTIELIVSCSSPDAVRIIARNRDSKITAPRAETRLGMAIVEAMMRSQQARFSWTLDSFEVQLELQKAPRQDYC